MEVSGWSGGPTVSQRMPFVPDVVAELEAERVAVEGQGGVGVVVREEAGVNVDVHDGHASAARRRGASRFLIGLVTFFASHDGMPLRRLRLAAAGRRWAARRPAR